MKNKVKKIVSTALLISVCLSLTNCRESSHHNLNRKFYVGTFKIDLEKSNFGDLEIEKDKYYSLTLHLLENDSFYFSMKAPFLRQQVGKWSMESVDNLYTAYLLYESNGRGGFIKDHVVITQELDLKIATPFGNTFVGKENQVYAKYLLFRKQ